MTYKRIDDEQGRPVPMKELGPPAFMQRLLLKRRLRRVTCPTEMADPASLCAQVQAAGTIHRKIL